MIKVLCKWKVEQVRLRDVEKKNCLSENASQVLYIGHVLVHCYHVYLFCGNSNHISLKHYNRIHKLFNEKANESKKNLLKLNFPRKPIHSHFVMMKSNAFIFVFGLQGPPQQGPLKFTIADTLERIKEEFNFLQQQYHTWVLTTAQKFIYSVGCRVDEAFLLFIHFFCSFADWNWNVKN